MFVAFGNSDTALAPEEPVHFLGSQANTYLPMSENTTTGAPLPLSYGASNFSFDSSVQDMYRESVSTGLQGVPFNLVGNILLEEQLLGSPHGYGTTTNSPPLSASDSDSQVPSGRRKTTTRARKPKAPKGGADESRSRTASSEKKGDRSFACPSCNKQFARKSNLVRHTHIHTSFKRFQCPHCTKGFTEKHHLKTHIRTHTGEYPFVCQHCGRPFRDRSNMLRHRGVCNGVAWAGYGGQQESKTQRKRAVKQAEPLDSPSPDEDPSFAEFDKSPMDAALDTVAAAAAAAPRLPEPDEESQHSDSTTSADFIEA